MARKKVTLDNKAPVSAIADCCGECEMAYDYCLRAHDGKPIACRCDERPGRIIFISEKACPKFTVRIEPIPDDIPAGPVPVIDGGDPVVPIFGDDPRKPVMYVPSKGLHQGMTTKEIIEHANKHEL